MQTSCARWRRLARVLPPVVLIALLGCARHEQQAGTAPGDSSRVLARPPVAPVTKEAHLAPSQPAGPQIGRGDPLINRVRPRLEEWAGMWRQALPGFELDSLWGGPAEHWAAVLTDTFVPVETVRDEPENLAFELLAVQSPDRRRILQIDSYQMIQPYGDRLEIGGEPDSKTDLIDLKRGRIESIQICGTGGGAHWGTWIDANQFALGQWREADDFGEWYQGQLCIYSIADSSVVFYSTRIVPAADFGRYRSAWEAWIDKRYRAFKAGRLRS